ncbi:MAG TPA: RNA 2',3'-cyclic phosphodiesterase [Microthrixaceae bacterium]|nr:RNA 2',3'-cyclic phosphodiesterase [Microthrixaceae bacterium]
MSASAERLFVAIWPPADVVAAIERLPRPEREGVRWVTPAQWHVTLRFFGRAEPAPVIEALADLDPTGTQVRLGPAVETLGRDVVTIPVAGLDDLAWAVQRATRSLGRPPEHRRFRGHLTLARVRGGVSSGVEGRGIEATFPVREVTLVASSLSSSGPTYRVVSTLGRTSEGP